MGDEVGALLMVDIAHISGLVATKQHPSPFEHCDVVTTTTHKSLRGPRSGMIFFKYSDAIPDIKERIDMAVFPALQGGPHNHQIGGLAAQLLGHDTRVRGVFEGCCIQLADFGRSFDLQGPQIGNWWHRQSLGSVGPSATGLTGSKVEKVCEAASISLNRNTVPGDASALSPGGVRIGTPAMTTRGCTTEDFKKIAEFLDRCASIALDIQKEKGKKLKDFEEGLKESKAVLELRKDVQAFSLGFGYPGL